jgi:Flp pilus assembly pilin Flp
VTSLNCRFFHDEDGLVTVEWVAIAGAVVIAGIAIVWVTMNNLQSEAADTGDNITACGVWAASHHGSTAGCTHGHHGHHTHGP